MRYFGLIALCVAIFGCVSLSQGASVALTPDDASQLLAVDAGIDNAEEQGERKVRQFGGLGLGFGPGGFGPGFGGGYYGGYRGGYGGYGGYGGHRGGYGGYRGGYGGYGGYPGYGGFGGYRGGFYG